MEQVKKQLKMERSSEQLLMDSQSESDDEQLVEGWMPFSKDSELEKLIRIFNLKLFIQKLTLYILLLHSFNSSCTF